jgi:hypothetical protein
MTDVSAEKIENNNEKKERKRTGDHNDVSGLELDVVDDLVLLKIELDGIVDLDDGVGVSDGSSVVGNDVGDALRAELDLSDLAELVGSLLLGDSVDGESTLDVVKDSEVLSRLLDGNNVHEPERVSVVGSDLSKRESVERDERSQQLASRQGNERGKKAYLAVNLDESLLEDSSDFPTGQSELQSVSEEDGQRKALSELVRSKRGHEEGDEKG